MSKCRGREGEREKKWSYISWVEKKKKDTNVEYLLRIELTNYSLLINELAMEDTNY